MCRKICYRYVDEAGEALIRLVLSGKAKNPQRVHVYWCKRCRAYHVGHRSHGKR